MTQQILGILLTTKAWKRHSPEKERKKDIYRYEYISWVNALLFLPHALIRQYVLDYWVKRE